MPNGRPRPSQGIGPRHHFFSLAYSPSGSRIVGGTAEGELYVWDAPSGNLVLGPLKGHLEGSIIRHICFFSEEIFLTAASDATVRQWNCQTGEPIGEPFTGHEEVVQETACLVDKKIVGSFARYGQVLTWHMDTLEVLGEFHVVVSANPLATFSRDGTRLVAVHHKSMGIYDVEHCQQLYHIDLNARMVLALTVAFAPDARSIYLCGGDAMLIWDVEKEDFEDEVLVGCDGIGMVTRCSPDGKLVATYYDDDTTCVWSTASREVIKVFDDSNPFAFSPDGRHFTHPVRGTELAINDVRRYLAVDPLSWLDHPATNQLVEAEEEQQDADQQSDFFRMGREEPDVISGPPVRRVEDNPLSPGSVLKTRGTGLMTRLFRRRIRSPSAQGSDQVSLELVYAARDKRPLVVASRERGVRIQERSSIDTTLDRPNSTWTVTSTSPSVAEEGDAQETEGEHYGCCYVCCFKLC
ncbi:quinon protein alcohol dehydrogenase-like superfamily [Pisolithus thermaeus]|nr:quinon protein alcohol dehydrogenase-like superfamily [Pisolithus thermaeus]